MVVFWTIVHFRSLKKSFQLIARERDEKRKEDFGKGATEDETSVDGRLRCA